MLTRTLAILLFAMIMGLLIAQRFYATPPQLTVHVAAQFNDHSDHHYEFGENIKRGSIVETENNFLELTIGEEKNIDSARIRLWLAKNTTIEFVRLFEDEITLKLKRGRVVILNSGNVPVTIETNYTSNKVFDDIVSFVNYDFLETVNVIPIVGTVQVYIERTGESLLTPAPLSIHETDPATYEIFEPNLDSEPSAEFYQWIDIDHLDLPR